MVCIETKQRVLVGAVGNRIDADRVDVVAMIGKMIGRPVIVGYGSKNLEI